MIPKPTKIRSKKLTNAAKGKSCTLRIPGICNGNNETVVACHLPGNKGTATKNHDLFTIDCCNDCHDWMDGRNHTEPWKSQGINKHEEMLRAFQETLLRRVNENLIEIK